MSTVGITGSFGFEPFTPGVTPAPDERVFETGLGYAQSEMKFVLENDSTAISRLVNELCSHMERFTACSKMCRDAIATALEEALTNAIFHGNLEVNSRLREYGDGDAFYRLARRRQQQRPYRDRRVEVSVRFTPRHAEFIVRDEGAGFDPDKVADPGKPAHIDAPCGRGMLMMRGLMDEVAHNDKGNEVRLKKRLS